LWSSGFSPSCLGPLKENLTISRKKETNKQTSRRTQVLINIRQQPEPNIIFYPHQCAGISRTGNCSKGIKQANIYLQRTPFIAWFQKISTPTLRKIIGRNFKGVGVSKAKIFKGKCEVQLEFSEGRGG